MSDFNALADDMRRHTRDALAICDRIIARCDRILDLCGEMQAEIERLKRLQEAGREQG
jgi:hypothetical protein